MGNILRTVVLIFSPFAVFLVLYLLSAAFSHELKTVCYTEKSGKIKVGVRLLAIADLHSVLYGEGQRDLIAAIDKQAPDVVLMAGDIVEIGCPDDSVRRLLCAVASKYPCFYVTGNHEQRTGRAREIKAMFAAHGVTVLAGNCHKIRVSGQTLSICGVDDPTVGEAEFRRQLKACSLKKSKEGFSVLLSHRPERVSDFNLYDFDLIISGHAHGGQVRLPYLLNGLYAPHQGIFPRYAGGRYSLKASVMIVSRGLAQRPWPRVFNRPELVVADLMPEE